MSPRRPRQRRVNKHVRSLHCECGHSYTRADFYERHLQTSGHNSEFIAVSHPTPDPASDSHYFYCSCGFSYTAAHAFHTHCKRTGHVGDWSRSKYQPKGHGSRICGTDSASAHGELSTATGHASSCDQPIELPTFQELRLATDSLSTDDSGQVPPLEGKEASTFNEADIQESLLSEGTLNDDDNDISEADTDHNQANVMDSVAASLLMTCASSIHNNASLTETSDNTDVSNSNVRLLNDNDDNASSATLLQSITSPEITVRAPHDRVGPLLRDSDATDPNARIANLRHGSRQISRTIQPELIKGSSSHVAQDSMTRILRGEQAMSNLAPDWKSCRTHTILKRLRGPFKAGVRKIGTSSCTLGKYITKHKGRLAAALLSAAVFAAAVHSLQSRPLLSDMTSSCQLGWRLDLNTSTHAVKDSEYYSNVGSVLNSDHSDAQATKPSPWTGTVPLYFNEGSMLALEDVLYDANAHTNILSLPKLDAAGISNNFSVAGATVYNALNDGPVGHDTVRENVHCLEGIPLPPSATYYPAGSTIQTSDPGSTPQNQLQMRLPAIGSRSGMVRSIDSGWSPHCKVLPFPASKSVTTIYPPFESALKATPTIFKVLKELIARDTTWLVSSQPAPPTSSMALPVDLALSGSSSELTSATSPVPAPKRKGSNDLGRSEESPRKQMHLETGIHQRIGRQLRVLEGIFANMTKSPLAWSSPRDAGTAHLRNGLGSTQHKTHSSTSTIPPLMEYPSSAALVTELSAGNADSLGKRAAACTLSGLSTRVDARNYALQQRAEMEKNEAETRLDLEKKIKQIENHACLSCEQCRRCWLF